MLVAPPVALSLKLMKIAMRDDSSRITGRVRLTRSLLHGLMKCSLAERGFASSSILLFGWLDQQNSAASGQRGIYLNKYS
jgi:hypothetical protein